MYISTPSNNNSQYHDGSLSPPATPGRKHCRGRSAKGTVDFPMFLSKSQSIVGCDGANSSNVDRDTKRLCLIDAHPSQSFSLKARPLFKTSICESKMCVFPTELPRLPFSFEDEAAKSKSTTPNQTQRKERNSTTEDIMNDFELSEQKYLDLLALSSTTSLKRASSAPIEGKLPIYEFKKKHFTSNSTR